MPMRVLEKCAVAGLGGRRSAVGGGEGGGQRDGTAICGSGVDLLGREAVSAALKTPGVLNSWQSRRRGGRSRCRPWTSCT